MPKQFLEAAGRPLVWWSIDTFARSGLVDGIVVAVAPDQRSRLDAILREGAWSLPVSAAAGGATRQESVWNALQLARDAAFVAVHDAVRPLFSAELLGRVLQAARENGAAIPAVPVTDTIHRVVDGAVEESPRRSAWFAAQTPQCFATDVLFDALRRARDDGFAGTDEASVVRRYGARVCVVPGDERNVKVTRPDDLDRVASLLGGR